ncbi:MAG: hypothetical protein IIB88_04370, partial [Chloroflexi bacterium]|nr:hypothetical protein [Chloroflexota bacterium]
MIELVMSRNSYYLPTLVLSALLLAVASIACGDGTSTPNTITIVPPADDVLTVGIVVDEMQVLNGFIYGDEHADIGEELASFKTPEGLRVNLFASEKDGLTSPLALRWDTAGRMFVTITTTYPHVFPGDLPNDKIIVLEDTDHDGKADKSTVFAEGLLVPHSVMPVQGGAYVCSATELLFLADRDGDDRADERRVVYSGFGNADVHHRIHGLRWAPWGEL